ncbi:major facilitator superfamily domain-containing protein 1-like isoform X1 [Mizuhopecten yessoensis]|uniref:major facilitator superfamily domain-containing protein 1-like isoform X1 n=1 Tax=Mizuhopecten yessoensis TaxID=6573 RepID=UPI000B45CBF1|nr:major facilitator superfamily domain-containing protein 1-like isoform X1 [Mizuhopecten yessoensis]
MIRKWRNLVLFCNCLLGYGLYFNVDILSALQKDLQGADTGSCQNVTSNTTCCSECVGLGPDRYNQLYAAYAWMTAATVIPGGYFVDRVGNRVSAIMSTCVAWLGTSLFALTVTGHIRGSSVMFPLMFCSRLLLGAGTGTALIVQDRILGTWFADNLSIVFSINVVALRLGNVSNFLLTANIANWIGFTWALWVGAALCSTAVLSAVFLSVLELYGKKNSDKKLTSIPDLSEEPVTLSRQIKNIRLLPKTYWLLCVTAVCYYSAYLPVISNGSKYIQDRYGYSKTTAAYYVGAVYDVSIIIPPFLGLLLKKFRCTGLLLSCSAILTAPVYLLLSYCSSIHPLVLTIYLGITYTTFAVCVWPCFAMLVQPDTFGTAAGIAIFMQSGGVGMTNLAVGKIMGTTESSDTIELLSKYRIVFWVLFTLSVLSAVFSVATNMADSRQNKLNSIFMKDPVPIEINDETSSLLPHPRTESRTVST